MNHQEQKQHMHNHIMKCCSSKYKNLCKVFCVVLIALLVVLTISYGIGAWNKFKQGKYIGREIETQNTITVSSTSEVYAKPDLALVSFSVVNEAKTANQTLKQNTEKMNAVISAVKKQGIEEKDLKTTNFSIYPRYEWRGRTGLPPYPQGKRVLVGYEVTQSLEVKIRALNKIGEILQAAIDAGANQVGNLEFTIDNQDELKKQARGQAINEAKVKAQELASQLGLKLVRIVNFSEGGVVPPMPSFYAMDEAIGKGGAEAPEIETGESKIQVTVTITYEIN